MFFRKITTKKNGKEYVYVKLIENYRQDGRVKQRVVANFGSMESLSPDRIRYLIASLRKLHKEIETQSHETGHLPKLASNVEEVRKFLSGSQIKETLMRTLDQQGQYELTEALIIKSVVDGEVNQPVHEVCKQMGLIDATSLQFYNALKKLGQDEVKVPLMKTRLPTCTGDKNLHNTIYIHLLPSLFEGVSYEVDVPGSTYLPQNYVKQITILLACDANSVPIDFEYVEDRKRIPGQINRLVTRLKEQQNRQVVVMDSESCLTGQPTNYLVAHPVPEMPKVSTQGNEVQKDKIFFNAVQYVQKSEVKVKEIKANLAKVSAGMETIKADILLGKLTKESAVRKRAETVIKSNRCEDMVSYGFNEATQDFNYHIREEVVKEKTQSALTTTWVIERSNLMENLEFPKIIHTKTNQFSVITDELKIPPINMYADYHYSPEIISGHIQLQIIKSQVITAMKEPGQGGES